MSDHEGTAAFGQPTEDATERNSEPARVVCDELRIRHTQCVECAASSSLVGPAPTVLDLRPQAWLDDDAAQHTLAERGNEAGQRLGRALGAARDREVVAAAKACANLECCLHSLGGKHVTVRVGVPPKLDLPTHVDDANSGVGTLKWAGRCHADAGTPGHYDSRERGRSHVVADVCLTPPPATQEPRRSEVASRASLH